MDFSRFPRKRLPKSEALFFEDEESHELYVLLTGSLGVFRDEVQVATIDQPLSMVGEISALTKHPRNATVRALETSNLMEIADPDRLFEEYPQLGAKLARVLAERLAAMNQKFVTVKGVLARTRAEAAAGAVDPTATMPPDDPGATLPPGVLPARVVMAAVRPAPAPQAAAAPHPPRRRREDLGQPTSEPAPVQEQLDEVMGALADLLDEDPTLSAGI